MSWIEALTPFRCKTSSSLLSNNILRPETAAAVPVGLLFLSVTATRCFILALFSRGGGGFTARRCTPPAAARQVAPSCPEQLAESEAGESRAAADGNGWSDRGLLRVHLRPATEHGTSLFPRLSLLILYGQTSLFSPSVVGSSSGRLFAFNSRLYSTTCWLCSLQTPAPAVCDSQVWKLCQRACMCAVQTGALRSALT